MLELAGRLHPLVVHLPVGILVLAVVFEWLSADDEYKYLQKSIRPMLWIGAFLSAAALLTGYLLLPHGTYDRETVLAHQWSGILLTVHAFVYAAIRTKGSRRLYRLLSVFLLVMILLTTHLGSALTHGADYLKVGSPSMSK